MNKKALGAIVATMLLLLVGVGMYIGVQTWYKSYQSELQANIIPIGNIEIEGFEGETLYIRNNNNANISFESIKINGFDCNINSTLEGSNINFINISSCLSSLSKGEKEVVIYSKSGIYKKNIFYKPREVFLVNSLDCSSLDGGDWILVPGNIALSTEDFCVMKYEAKATTSSEVNLYDSSNMYCGDGTDDGTNYCYTDGRVNITSKASSIPLSKLYQTQAITLCENLGSGYHLINDSEWVTIGRNIENVSSNWADGSIGSTIASGGGLKRGNIGTDDSASYDATGYSVDRVSDTNSKAMLTLSNGETIWDFSGNVAEFTNNTFDTNSESAIGTSSDGWHEWTEITGYDYLESINHSYDSTYGIGRVYTWNGDVMPSGTIHVFGRGGNWAGGGFYNLDLAEGQRFSDAGQGFRCTYTN